VQDAARGNVGKRR